MLRGVCEVWKRENNIQIWSSWILVRLMTVYEERDCGMQYGVEEKLVRVCKGLVVWRHRWC